MSNLLAIFAFVAYALFVAVLLLVVVQTIRHSQESKSWPTVSGLIIRSEVREIKNANTGPINKYREYLEYEYIVDGRTYTCGLISIADTAVLRFNSGTRSGRVAKQIVKMYPLGQSVTVHYDPRNPEIAVLETQIFNTNFLLLTVLVFIMVAFLITILTLPSK